LLLHLQGREALPMCGSAAWARETTDEQMVLNAQGHPHAGGFSRSSSHP
jgi:hypothetical protein